MPLHSNLVIFQCPTLFVFNTTKQIFTFQSGHIPIRHFLYLTQLSKSLHSNLVIFQFLPKDNLRPPILALHSNLVIFQSSCYNTIYLQTLKAAFCRPSFFNPSYRNIFCELFLLSLFRPLLQ